MGRPDLANTLPSEAEELVARFHRPLMAYFRRRVREREDAEDLTQEVFLRILGRDETVPVANPEIYIFRIAANLLRDRARWAVRHQTSDHTSLDDLVDPNSDGPTLQAALLEDRGPERVVVSRQSLLEVMRALDELGPRIRDIFIMSRLEKMKHRDIAAVYGLTVSSVEKYIARCELHLARRFGAR